MSLYGRGKYGGGKYGSSSLSPGSTGLFVNLPVAIQARVVDVAGNTKCVLQSGVTPWVSASFGFDKGGCSAFTLSFSNYVNIAKSDRVYLRLFDDAYDFFTGVVRGVPIEGSTTQKYDYTGYGLNDYLARVNAEAKTYANKTLTYILADLINTIILPKTPVLFSAANLIPPSITVTSLVCNYAQLSDVLDALKKIADSSGDEYLWGVDQDGYFFFRPRSSTVEATLLVGARGPNGIEAYEPSDELEQKTKLFVLRKDGTYYATLTSALTNDVWEEKVTGPDVADADLLLWATGQLLDKERAVRSAVVQWSMAERPLQRIFADGWVRILATRFPTARDTQLVSFGDGAFGDGDFGGPDFTGIYLDDTLSIMAIEYEVAESSVSRKLTLGALPLSFEREMAELNKKLVSLEISLGV